VLYFDTGCLVKLYYPEPDSPAVAGIARGQPLVYTVLHELEISAALQLKIFRGEAKNEQSDAAQAAVDLDVAGGKLCRLSVSLREPFDRAVTLARQHAARIGCRSLDLLHCAIAATLDVEGFLSTDERQAALAKAIGLPLLTIP